jgi:hypothetical protein
MEIISEMKIVKSKSVALYIILEKIRETWVGRSDETDFFSSFRNCGVESAK